MGAYVSSSGKAESNLPQRITIKAQPITSENFKIFGQVIGATDDGKLFDSEDAALKLDEGTPRFYIMRIPRRGLTFDRITFHEKVTQCLGGLNTEPWYLAVAPPSGSVDNHPTDANIKAFKIPHGCFVKLHVGTWHAGPLFEEPEHFSFYNLELADTNVVDHNTHSYKKDGVEFCIVDT